MGKQVDSIGGISPSLGAVLRDAGVGTVDKLLETACNKKGRASLAGKTYIKESRLLKWANMADLFRIRGIAGQYAELLKGAGVNSVKDLRHQNAKKLVAKMDEVNSRQGLVGKIPAVTLVASWVEQAKALPPKVSH